MKKTVKKAALAKKAAHTRKSVAKAKNATKAVADLQAQAATIAEDLGNAGIKNVDPKKEIVAVIAYLQRLGTDIKKMPAAASGN